MSVPSQPIITNKYPFTLSDRVELYWQAPLSNGGNAITSYIIECPNIPYIEVLSNTANKTTISNLTVGSQYLFSIKATNINGNSNPAFYNLVQTGFKPAPPTNLEFTSNIDNFSKLQFNFNNTSNIGNSNILFNVITMTPVDVTGNILENSSFKYFNSSNSNINNPIIIERTNTNFDYKAHVRARNSINFSDRNFSEFIVNPNLPTNGLKLWLDPYDITTLTLSNSKVTRWIDKSFNKANATISETFAPTYDSNTDVLVFNGNQYLNLPANTLPSGNTSYTIFTYVSTSNISRIGQWFLHAGTPQANLSLGGLINGNLITQSWFNNNQISNSNINSSISYLLEMNYTNGLRKTLINGNLIAQDFVGFRNTTTGNNIIGSNSTINGNLVGTIGDIIIYDRLLNDIERRSIRNYLERKKFTLSLQNMGNLVLWLDSSDNNTLYDNNIKFKIPFNSNVFSWVDKSGRNNNARQPNITLAPIRRPYIQNNLDVLEFNQSYLTIPTAYYPLDSFIVLKLNNNAETYGILGVGPNSNNYSSLSYNTSGGNLWSINNTSNSIISGNVETSGNFLLMEWSINSNSNVIRRYGSNISNVTTGTFTLPTNSNIIIGNNNGFDFSKRFKGYIGELIMFDRQLNDNDRQQIEGYLAWKWGLQSFLASNHPFKNLAPYLFTRLASAGSNLPGTIPNLLFWLDANDDSTIIKSGSIVTQWRDKSSTSNHFTSSGSAIQSTDSNKKTIYIPYNTNLTSPNYITTTTSTRLLGVSRCIATSGDFEYIISLIDIGDKSVRYWNSQPKIIGGSFNYYDDSNDMLGSSVSINAKRESSAITSSETVSVMHMWDGLFYTTFNSRFQLGLSGGRSFQGHICEILMYSSMTNANYQAVQGYLAWKWGLNDKLPITHPYKNSPP
jgi:hypothetical protein